MLSALSDVEQVTNMKKKRTLLLGLLALSTSTLAQAGGLLTNTSLSAMYIRMMARNASLQHDAAYYNPAGLVFTADGWKLSLNSQTVFQRRDIDATYAPFAYSGSAVKRFEGKATAPVLPSIMASYKRGDWAFSGVFGVFGGGGKANFHQGLPQFEGQIAMIPALLQGVNQQATALAPLMSLLPEQQRTALTVALGQLGSLNSYSLNSHMQGLQYIFGLQLGASYKFNQHLSGYVGARLSYAYNTYSGHIGEIRVGSRGGTMIPAPLAFAGGAAIAQQVGQALQQLPEAQRAALGDRLTQVQTLLGLPGQLAQQTADRTIDVKQTGLGIAPVLGLNFNYDRLNIGARYEFRSAITVKNKTTANTSGLSQFDADVETPNDQPALLGVGVSYRVLPTLTAAVSYNHIFEKQAHMSADKQKSLDRNTNEVLVGLEWNALKWLDVSGGVQYSNKGVTDAYQSNLHFDMSATSVGFGVGLKVTQEAKINLGYMLSDYKEHTKEGVVYTQLPAALGATPTAKEVYSRKNQIFTIGLDYTL